MDMRKLCGIFAGMLFVLAGCTGTQEVSEPAEPEVVPVFMLDGTEIDRASRELCISGTVTAGELEAALPELGELETLTVKDCCYTPQEQTALCAAFPSVSFVWDIQLGGKSVPSDTASLTADNISAEELLTAAPLFTGLTALDLSGSGFENEKVLQLAEAFPQAEIRAQLSLYGQEFSTDVQELDFSGITIEDPTELEELMPLLKGLKKVVMSDCGLSNEEMDALNKRHEDVRFVWTIYFGRAYYLRTDETAFIASLFQGKQGNYSNLYNDDVEVLKYCEDMVALDLGHMSFTNCEFVRSMPHLRYLILADTPVEDISPLAELKELWYCELFGCNFNELAPLLECPALRHLNLCYLDLHDLELLEQMTYLEQLWLMSPYLSRDEYEWLQTILPDTVKQLGMRGSATGGGWRQHPAYFEMRDAFGAFYISQ